jgi:hypothetical protein
MMEDRFLKRLRKKARKGLRGWPIATIAFYGPNLSQARSLRKVVLPSPTRPTGLGVLELLSERPPPRPPHLADCGPE